MTRAGDDVAFGLENAGTPPELIWPAVDAALDAVGFALGRDRATAALSGGQKQRLVLAGALAPARGCCCSTSRPPSSTRTARRWSAPPSPGRWPTGRRPWSSSTTTSRPGCRWSTGWWSCCPAAAPASTPRAGGPPRCRCPQRRPHAAGRAAAVHAEAAGFTHRGSAVAVAAAHRRRAARRPHAGRHRPERHRASPPWRCCSPACARPTTGAVVAGPALTAGLRRPDRPPHRWRADELVEPDRHGLPAARAPVPHRPGARRARAGAAAVRRRDAAAPAARPRSCSSGSGWPPLAEANPFTLSGGQQRRLSVATALATRPGCSCSTSPPSARTATPGRSWWPCWPSSRTSGRALCLVTHDAAVVARARRRRALPSASPVAGMSAPLSLGPARPVPLSAVNPVAQLSAIVVVTGAADQRRPRHPAGAARRRAAPAARRRAGRARPPAAPAPGRCCSAPPGSPGSTSPSARSTAPRPG